MSKCKFNVGDIVKGNNDRKYFYTTTKMTKAVVVKNDFKYYGDDIEIKVLEHTNKEVVGSVYTVNSDYFDLVERADSKKKSKETIVIYRNDNEVVALDKTTGKKAVAKCNPDDEFDFQTGAKLAFNRLMGTEKKKIKKLLSVNGTDYGTIGTPTCIKDINGEQLFVGDVVEVFNKEMVSSGYEFIVKNGESAFVMGLRCNCSEGKHYVEITDGWKIIKRRSFHDLKVGEKVGIIRVVEEEVEE